MRSLRPLGIAAAAFAVGTACADEGGTSFWLPGQFGSFAAVPGDPGWSLPLVYYHTSVEASGEKSFAIGGRITAGLKARADLLFAVPTYVFSSPFAGAQASVGLAAVHSTRIDTKVGSSISDTPTLRGRRT